MRAQVTGQAPEPFERCGSLNVTAQNTDEHLRVPKISTGLGPRNGHQARDPRVFYAFGEECCDRLADGLRHAIRTTRVVGHVLPVPQLEVDASVRATCSVR